MRVRTAFVTRARAFNRVMAALALYARLLTHLGRMRAPRTYDTIRLRLRGLVFSRWTVIACRASILRGVFARRARFTLMLAS